MGRSPVVETLLVMAAVYVFEVALALTGRSAALALSAAGVAEAPWTLVTSVYAHVGLGHLVANAVTLGVVGPFVARRTTRARFHAFFVTTGAAAGASEVVVGGLFGEPPLVLGASGAVFALVGYVLSGNVVASTLLDWVSLSRRAKVLLLVTVVVGLTLATGSSRAALVAHAVGLALGLVAGRLGVLDVSRTRSRSQAVGDVQRD